MALLSGLVDYFSGLGLTEVISRRAPEILNERNEDVVMQIFKELHSMGHTILMVTHDPKIGNMAQRKIRLEHGKLNHFK